MPTVDFEDLTRPVLADDPCGADLELSGDIDYMNFVASAEGSLPKSFFGKDQSGTEDRPFDRSSIDFAAQFNAAKPFLEKTRDLRLLVLLTKFCALDRDLPGFVTCLRALGMLLESHWDDVHPRGEDGSFDFRGAVMESIDDLPTVVMPLQFLPIIENRRTGPISYRNYAIATGEISPREGEAGIETAVIEKAMEDTDLPVLIGQRRHFEILHDTIAQIRKVWLERGGTSISLERLPPLVDKILALLDGVVARKDPSAALVKPDLPADGSGGDTTAEAAGARAAIGRVSSAAEAAAALSVVAEYLGRAEPSNPALLLIRQAQQLVGKSFVEIMQVLVPTHVPQAVINIGKTKFFGLPIEQLSSVVKGYEPGETSSADEATSDQDADQQSEAVDGEETGQPSSEDAAATDGDSSEPAIAAAAPAVAFARRGDGSSAAAPRYKINSRQEALLLLEMVGAHFRNAEPTSPIPFLIDRARDLAVRDFLSVLSALLPEDALKSINLSGSVD